MIKSLLILSLLAILLVSFSPAQGLSCRDEYRCTSKEYCWNGECVKKDMAAGRRRFEMQYGYDVAKKSKQCDFSRDCRGLGAGYVCSKGTCRLIHRL